MSLICFTEIEGTACAVPITLGPTTQRRPSAKEASEPKRIKLLLWGMTQRADRFKAGNNRNPKILMNKM